MPLPDAFLTELRARTPMSALVGRKVNLRRSGREWIGKCCFHDDETPSMHVYEGDDPHLHCFGCQKHLDAIGFVMETERLGFLEAVEQLAAECGLDVPRDPAAEAEIRKLSVARDVLDAHAEVWQERLWGAAGTAALAYLHGRGLTDATLRAWGVGWVGREGVLSLPRDDLDAAGLMWRDEHGRPVKPLFNGRIMFPIRDARGKIVGFSGRAMGDGMPKYLNGPETAVFSKGRTLYGLDRARKSDQPVRIVEGQIDVLACDQLGRPAAASLGTAFTAEHLAAFFAHCRTGILTLDGDEAGRKATRRILTEIAPPLLDPEHTLLVATLPEGQDPGSLLTGMGAEAATAALDRTVPYHVALYDLLAADCAPGPEGRAALEAAIKEAAGRIADKALAREYRTEMLDRYFAERRARRTRPAPVLAAQFANDRVPDAAPEQARHLAALVLRHPALLGDVAERWVMLDLPDLDMARLRDCIVAQADEDIDAAILADAVEMDGFVLADLLGDAPTPLPPSARAGANLDAARTDWWHLYMLLTRASLEDELAAAEARAADSSNPADWQRLAVISQAWTQARTGKAD